MPQIQLLVWTAIHKMFSVGWETRGLITPTNYATILRHLQLLYCEKSWDNIIPSNFTVRTGRKFWCDRGNNR